MPNLKAQFDELAVQAMKIENMWAINVVRLHAPGLAALADSGQWRSAMIFARAQGYEWVLHPDGKRELRRNGQILASVKLDFRLA